MTFYFSKRGDTEHFLASDRGHHFLCPSENYYPLDVNSATSLVSFIKGAMFSNHNLGKYQNLRLGV